MDLIKVYTFYMKQFYVKVI